MGGVFQNRDRLSACVRRGGGEYWGVAHVDELEGGDLIVTIGTLVIGLVVLIALVCLGVLGVSALQKRH